MNPKAQLDAALAALQQAMDACRQARAAIEAAAPAAVVTLPARRIVARPLPPQSRFREFCDRYPKRADLDSMARDWISCDCDQHADEVFACLDRYLASAEVAGGAVQNAGSNERTIGWIVRCYRDGWQNRWPPAQVAPPRRLSLAQQMAAEIEGGRDART